MKINEIKDLLMSALALDEAYVSGDGNHVQVIAISKQFSGMSMVKKQQTIYAPLIKHIANNSIHSLSIKTYTPEEWRSNRKLYSFLEQ
ncbi:BolA family protein [Candidatus Palibaumannia cicadellinicola]|uniref:BolA DNA-binding transcriptional dual regulator n=1 Tax=Candidatus Palibaumannia cicadellinicola TaxID=186490 RepID=A0A088MXB4_9GAMM|nr:BolA family protein [Candidatus Baumannia cicadellinicola]AIN46922.1 BolA DNA-binding transcriptional dual regulator [Candidatus Baumannia cicadellinicola]